MGTLHTKTTFTWQSEVKTLNTKFNQNQLGSFRDEALYINFMSFVERMYNKHNILTY
jgi:hypothetical protein